MDNPTPYPHRPLVGRYRRAFLWTPAGINRYLDAGCAWGYGAVHFTAKSREVVGLDPTPEFIAAAQVQYPDLTFVLSDLEATPLPDGHFEAIACCDTIEHVRDEVQCFRELFRMLKPGGTLTVTTPHRGLFAWLDPANSVPYADYFARRYLGFVYRLLYWFRKHQWPGPMPWTKPIYTHDTMHRHYRRQELLDLIEQAVGPKGYRVVNTVRSGLFLGVGVDLLMFVFTVFFPRGVIKKVGDRLLFPPLQQLAEWDYWIPYGPLAYNIAIQVEKTPD